MGRNRRMDLKLLGGALALDFVNTRDPLLAADAREYLVSPPALVEWGKHVGVLSPRARLHLSDDDLARAHETRATLERLFTAPTRSDGRAFAVAYARALADAQLAPTGDGFR